MFKPTIQDMETALAVLAYTESVARESKKDFALLLEAVIITTAMVETQLIAAKVIKDVLNEIS